MIAAITLVLLFGFSTLIVRFAATFLRHTGLPDHIARLQSISALSGTGFTTSESELIVNFPIRRKVLVFLMILGNLGIASVSTTFIIALIGTDGEADAVIKQVIAFVIAIGGTLFVMSNKKLDQKFCDGVSWYLARNKAFQDIGFNRVTQFSALYSIAEHKVRSDGDVSVEALNLDGYGLALIGARTGKHHDYESAENLTQLSPNDVLICYGNETAHTSFAHH